METSSTSNSTITSPGFQFVLHTPNDQLWDLLLQYFHLAEVSLCVRNIVFQLSWLCCFRSGKWIWSRYWVSYSCFRPWSLEGWLSSVILRRTFNLMAARQEYSTENLSGTQKAMLEDLRDYGLIWQRKVWFWIPLDGFWPLRQSLHHGVSIPPVLRPPWLLLLHRFLPRPAVVPGLKKGSLFSKPIIGYTHTQVFQFA